MNEVTTVAEAPGNFLSWPKSLVDLVAHELSNKEKEKGESGKLKESVTQSNQIPVVDPKTLTPACKRLLALVKIMSLNSPITIHMYKGIMGEDLEYKFYMTKEDLMHFLAMEELDVSCIQLFIMCLYCFCGSMNRSAYGFLCPQAI